MPVTADQMMNFGAALLGAGILELMYWREIYQKLESGKYRKLIRSKSYWLLTSLFILGSAFGSIVWNDGGESTRLRDYFIIGAAFGPIVKATLKSFSEKHKLGDNTIDTYLFQ